MITDSFFRSATRILWLCAGVAALRYMPYQQLDNWALFFLAGVLALPIAVYRLEYRLFVRRAVIMWGFTPNGLVKKYFWNGFFVKGANYFISIVPALLIIVICSALTNTEWLIIAAAIPVLILFEAVILSCAKKQTRDDFLNIFQRGLIKWPVIALIAILSSIIFIDTSYPRYVDQDVLLLAEGFFDTSVHSFNSTFLVYARATLSSLNLIVMYWAQTYIPRIDDTTIKWVLWGFLALKSTVSTGFVVYLLLGLLTLASIKERKGWKFLGQTAFDKAFILTFIVLFITSYAARNKIPSARNVKILPAIVDYLTPTDCTATIAAAQSENANRARELSKDELALTTSVESKIDKELINLFESAENGVDRYLDWRYSVVGEYQQLAAQLLSTRFDDSPDKFDQYVRQDINNKIKLFGNVLNSDIIASINESSRSADFQLPPNLPVTECLPSLDLTPLIFKLDHVYVAQPQVLVTAGTIFAKKIAAKSVAKLGVKSAAKIAATGMTATAVCAPLGPVAAACGIGAAVVTWVGVDIAITAVDEYQHRDEERQRILDELETQRATIKSQMISLKLRDITGKYDAVKAKFHIPSDGV